MTNILAIDTATPACSVALTNGEEILARHKIASREHTQLLLPMVDDVLAEGGMALSQIDVIAFTAGPGSFTGIRIGFGVVQGLAFGAEIPVLPISSLETLAHTAIRKLGIQQEVQIEEAGLELQKQNRETECFDLAKKELTIVPMLDARMDEIYWAQFQLPMESKAPNDLQRRCVDSLSPPEETCTEVNKSSAVIVVGDGWNYSDRIGLEPTMVDAALLPEAQDILTIAKPMIRAGQAIPIEQASPIYLRDKITWKKRQRLRTA